MTNKPQIDPKLIVAGIIILAVGAYFSGIFPMATVSDGIVSANVDMSDTYDCEATVYGQAKVTYAGTYYVKACWVQSGIYKCTALAARNVVNVGDSNYFNYMWTFAFLEDRSISADVQVFDTAGKFIGISKSVMLIPCAGEPEPTPTVTPAPTPTPPPCTDSPVCVWDSQGLYKIEKCDTFIEWCNWGDSCSSGTCIPPAPSPTPTAPSPTPTLPPEPDPTPDIIDDEDAPPSDWWYSYAVIGGGIVIVALLLFRRPRMPVRAGRY